MKLVGRLSKTEYIIWFISLIVVTVTHFLSPQKDWLNFVASLIGVTSLILIARGYPLGMLVCVIFGLVYAITSYKSGYYGEMITYAGMTAPVSLFSFIVWLKNPYGNSAEVKIKKLTIKNFAVLIILTIAITVGFYFILRALNTTNLIVSTISIATSFLAVALTILRSPYYAIAYSLNDVVLIVLWIIQSLTDTSYLTIVACFAVFLVNDLYGFISWKRREKLQKKNTTHEKE